MAQPSYRALRILLGFLALLLAIGGVAMICSSKALVLRMFMHPPESEVSILLLAAVKEMGGLALTLNIMLVLAARDPLRNVAIIDALTIGLCILAITPVLSLYMLDVKSLYPAYLIWGRAVARLALAGAFFLLRPRPQWKAVANS